jgi:hypothetical protein
MVNSLQPPCSPCSSLLNLGSALGPHDLPTVVNDITPIATSTPHIPKASSSASNEAESIASVRVTPDPKWFMLAGRTLDLVYLTAILARRLARSLSSRPACPARRRADRKGEVEPTLRPLLLLSRRISEGD